MLGQFSPHGTLVLSVNNKSNSFAALYPERSSSFIMVSLEDSLPRGPLPSNGARLAPDAPHQDLHAVANGKPTTYLGTQKRLPEMNLVDHVVLVSGAARGLGLTQAEALLEAGAIVYALDRLEEPVKCAMVLKGGIVD